MDTPTPLCECSVCIRDAPVYYVTPPAQLRGVRDRAASASYGRLYCPRCGERLGLTESVLDSVGYSHFVQPCAVCSALWVLS